MVSSNNTLREWGAGFAVLFLYMLPLLILGENAHIRVHDNLDSNIAWYKVLSESGQLFGSLDATIPQIMNGQLSRNAFGTEFSGIVWLHHIFPTMTAYVISQIITRVFAFIGMYWLLRDYVISDRKESYIRVGVSIAFALTPFWPSGMLSTLGMPLALWAFLNLRRKIKGKSSFLILTLLPLYSSFVLGFFFFLAGIGLWCGYDLFIKRNIRPRFFLGLLYMTLLYLLIEYRLVSSFVIAGEANSRDEYAHAHLNFLRTLRLVIKNFVLGHTHVMSVHGLIILPILLIALYIVIRTKQYDKYRSFLLLWLLNVLLSVWYAFWFYKGWKPVIDKLPFLNSFNFARFHFLRPMVIYVSFAQALLILKDNRASISTIRYVIIAQIAFLFLFNDEVIYHRKPSVKEFYAVEQFEEIKKEIGLPVSEYRVVSIGLHPSIAQYNGLYTLDSYNNFYPLAYKHRFRKVIAKELAKNRTIRKYFDQWGGRCYVFVAELGKHYMFKKDSKKTIRHLELDPDELAKLGGTYIISSLPIQHPERNALQLSRVFESKSSAWRIYLYELIPLTKTDKEVKSESHCTYGCGSLFQ